MGNGKREGVSERCRNRDRDIQAEKDRKQGAHMKYREGRERKEMNERGKEVHLSEPGAPPSSN